MDRTGVGVGIGRGGTIGIIMVRRMAKEMGAGISMDQENNINIDTMMKRGGSIVIALGKGNDVTIDDIGREMGIVVVAIDKTFQAR
jgi:hypothetical protein